MKIKKGGFILMALIVVLGAIAVKTLVIDRIPRTVKESHSVGKVALPDAPEASLGSNATKLGLPTSEVASIDGAKVDWKIMAWNSQFGLMYANGGAQTTKGSLMEKANVNVSLVRQDDCNKSCADLVKFAQDYKDNPETPGVLITFMGDGMPPFMTSLSKQLEPLGPEFQPVIIFTFGKSYGEDQVMAPLSWKENPKSALGGTCAAVLRDGDMNILLKWAGDNNIKVNPDEKTYDYNAVNIVSANDFLDAPNKYISGYTEKRKIVVNGKTTGRDTTVGVDAVATWTPGDVNVVEQKGGLVTLASTKDYSTQMPNMTIAIKKWANDHRTDVENMIVALAQAGDQVRSYDEAKKFAAKVSAEVYKEKDANYWYTYYNGRSYDANTQLGGSMVFNLRDMSNMLGLGDDHIDRYKIVYTTFGDILSKMYPEFLKDYTPYTKAVDKSFTATVLSNHPELLDGKGLTVEYAQEITSKVSSKSYQIKFATGSAEIDPDSYDDLDGIMKGAMVAENLKVGVYGHTDNTGNPENNLVLSKQRAESVAKYLSSKGLPSNRVESKGLGDKIPTDCQDKRSGNNPYRRVVNITLGK